LGKPVFTILKKIASRRCNFGIRLLSGSLSEYWRATRMWWQNIERFVPQLGDRPVYFVSSNTHSITNLLTGYALSKKDDLLKFLESNGNYDLLREWEELQECNQCASSENFFYYTLKKFQQTAAGAASLVENGAR